MGTIKIISLLLLIPAMLFAQSVYLNEVMTKNRITLIDEDEDTPDWIEIYNGGNTSLNLSGYSISDRKSLKEHWIFPEFTLAADSFIVLFASGKDKRNIVSQWETVITQHDFFNYMNGYSGISPDWNALDYNDDNWNMGRSGFGYGDGDDTTVLDDAVSVYVRKKFNIDDLSKIVSSVFHIDFDDGFIAYINGVEIARYNMGSEGSAVSYNTFATENHEAQMYSGGLPEEFVIDNPASILVEGENVLAVEAHNVSSTSSDMSLIPFLTLGMSQAPSNPAGTPDFLDFPESFLHTDFSLSSSGETLYLFNPESTIVDSILIPELPADISYGRSPIEHDSFLFFKNSTPGRVNNAEGFTTRADAPVIIQKGGFYYNRVEVGIDLEHAAQGASVFYTLDGSIPDTNSIRYTSPIEITGTTVLRAVAVIKNGLPSRVISQTYLINKVTNLPVISLITDPPNLWDYNEGIYVLGPNAETADPHFGANFWQDWEKEAFLQFFETDKSLAFETNLGIKIFGAWSRAWAMKSLSLFARNKYGSEYIDYNIFPEQEYDRYKSVILRNSGNDWNITMFRDAFIQVLFESTNIDIQAYRPAVVYINGEYWGIHNIREKINEDYLARHYDLDPDKIDILENNASVVEGSNQHYRELTEYVETHNLFVPQYYEEISKRVDIDNFIDYTTAQIFIDNTDWPGNNIKFWRPQSEDGKWRWILYDTDFGFGIWNTSNYLNNTLSFALEENGPDWPNPPWSTLLLRSLLRNPEFKNKFINRFADLTNTILSYANCAAVIDSLSKIIKIEMPNHINRWGAFSYSSWQSNVESMKTFGKHRIASLRNHYNNEFSLGGIYNLQLHINNPKAGSIKLNSLNINQQDWQGVYFKNNDIVLNAVPKHGYKFIRWTGDVESTERLITVSPTSATDIQAVFEKDEYVNSIVINEINYNSSPDYDTEDWIELYNNSNDKLDLSGWYLTDSNFDDKFTLPEGSELSAGEFIILSHDSAAFTSLISDDINICGDFAFALSNGGDEIRLYDNANLLIDSLTYDDVEPWPLEPDGFGQTLSLINPAYDNSLAENWQSSKKNGTPGRQNDVFVTGTEDKVIADEYCLKQNYPNPFNPSTIIEYSIPVGDANFASPTNVKLIVYDILGREVATLVNKKQNTGSYKVLFDGTQLASGLYMYRLTAGKYTATNKMILIK